MPYPFTFPVCLSSRSVLSFLCQLPLCYLVRTLLSLTIASHVYLITCLVYVIKYSITRRPFYLYLLRVTCMIHSLYVIHRCHRARHCLSRLESYSIVLSFLHLCRYSLFPSYSYFVPSSFVYYKLFLRSKLPSPVQAQTCESPYSSEFVYGSESPLRFFLPKCADA